MRRILFLDIDGVLNGYPFLDELEENARPLSDAWWAELIDPSRVELLNRILDATGAEVVLSSSWRLRFDLERMQRFLEDAGFTGQLVEATSDEPRGKRGAQIARWIAYQPEPVAWVCLDDDLDMAEVAEGWIQTSPERGGLTPDEVERAIARLESFGDGEA